MSFLTETAIRRLATVSRTAAISNGPRATFTTSARMHKTATETVKDSLKTVDRAVSGKLVDGIDVAASVGNKIKEAGSEAASGKATGKAEQYRAEVSGKTSELSGEASGKASEMTGQAKGKASELAGKAKGKAEEIKQKM